MKNVYYIWKSVGFTPLQVVEKFKEKYPEYKNETVSYAGRLDPMAEGILILLIGEENKKRSKYLRLQKVYESEIVLGISTDTFDGLGLVTSFNLNDVPKAEIGNFLNKFVGKQKQTYPAYSSKAVKGKPLFWWARENRLDEIKLPTHEIEIYAIDILDFKKIYIQNLASEIINNIEKIDGDFRQKEIIKAWNKLMNSNKGKELVKFKIKISCSSGTYVRKIADDLGEKLETGAFAYSIKRTRIGKISGEDCLRLI
jgi:tRNA pseudouridine(55) synthase